MAAQKSKEPRKPYCVGISCNYEPRFALAKLGFSAQHLRRSLWFFEATIMVWWVLAFLLFFRINAYANDMPALKLENSLAACIQISKPEMYTAQGILFAKISYTQKESVAACGCKSLDSDFISTGGRRGNTFFLIKGNIMFGKTGTMNLPLNVNQLPIPASHITLSISCAEQ